MKRITQQDLQSLYGPAPEELENRMRVFLSGLPEKEEKSNVKKKASLAFVLAAVLVLAMAATAAAGLIDWNAVIGIYGHEKPEMNGMVTTVNKSASAFGTTLSVSSALTDGRTLVFDWTLEAEEEELPLFLTTSQLLVNGVHYITEFGGGLYRVWLQPGETVRQSSEVIEMFEQRMQPGEQMHVEWTVRIAKPKKPITFLDSREDRGEAERLRSEGTWAVAPLGEANVFRFDDENNMPNRVTVWNHYRKDGFTDEDFELATVKLIFDVTVPETEKIEIYPAGETIRLKECTAYLREAYRTELGVYTTVELVSDADADEEGNIARQLSQYELFLGVNNQAMHVNGNVFSDMPWIGEDGKVHQVLSANMIGYQNSLLEEGNVLSVILMRPREEAENLSGNIPNYYVQYGCFNVYFEKK